MAVSSILVECGFDGVDKVCLETLCEMIQSLLSEVGESSRSYCELAGRTTPVIADVIVALVNMGMTLDGIESYANREERHALPAPQQMTQGKPLSILQAGTKNSHPSHIPNYLPPLPDPHAYIRTPTHKQPVTEYEAIREKAANQKRDIEKALTKFLAKTSETQSLFDVEDNQMFPLIACKPAFPSYFAALNPTDQVFDFEELEYHFQVANRTEDITTKDESENEDDEKEMKTEDGMIALEKDIKVEGGAGSESPTPMLTNPTLANNEPNIDNPYLRAAIPPKKMKTAK